MNAPTRPARPVVHPLGPDSAALVSACIVVGTAAFLGVWWLKSPVLALPVGVWLILGWYAAYRSVLARRARIARLDVSQSHEAPAESGPDSSQLTFGFVPAASGQPSGQFPDLGIPPLTTAQRALLGAATPLTRAAAPLARRARGARIASRLSDWHDRRAWPALPIRIATSLPASMARELARGTSDPSFLWMPVSASGDPDRDACAAGFDAFVWKSGDGRLRVSMPEHAGRDAGWYDWSVRTPFSYASVFPPRIDPARITLPDSASPLDLSLARLLIETGAILSRSPARLTLGDRLRGRRPLGSGPLGRAEAVLEAAVSARLSLALTLASKEETGGRPEVRRIAARVASAYFAARDSAEDLDERRRGIDLALRLLGDEPEAALRAVAARYASGDEPEGLRAAVLADRIIRAQGLTPIADPLSFLHSEMEMGSAGPATFGRVAAGVTLVCATTPDDRYEYLKEDLGEDLRFSSWFVGRDADVRALMEILRTLGRGDRPAAKAA